MELDAVPFRLESGAELKELTIAYQAYGTLNADRSNVVLICHALTMDQHAANPHPITGKPGWWDSLIGPGKVVDTNRYYVLCPNVLGSCMGTTG
ncbi:MAG: homoserine O-acetyltransferase, partial [Alphaproteobacteria bacterium]|nr:homoserine O-acetyltransferase [Alphaproteobacteria bacterium]